MTASTPQPQPTDAVIVGGARTPFTRLLGQQAGLQAVELGAHAIRHALERSGVPAEDVDMVYLGQVVQAGAGQNPARQAALAAGIGWDVPAMTLNKVCLSGLVAVTDAARLIRLGEARVVVAGGQESMTNAPHLMPKARKGFKYGQATLLDSVEWDGLTDTLSHEAMGELTESGNAERGLSRAEQDEVAAASHQRAAQAQADGVFDAEIASVEIPQRKGEPLVVSQDEGVRPDATVESLGGLRPAFTADGTITAGNSSPLSDGAAALVVTSRAYAEERGLPVLATVGAAGQTAGPDSSQLHSQPADAVKEALRKQGWDVADLDFVEINEAFGAVAVQSLRDLDYPLEKTNIHGGAIALGHPIGASGARLALHAALELDRRGGGRAAVSLCGGGGQGEALILFR
ncbi:acetyl-CoA C-acetyltransferase [Micrococcus flavus]|uniref:Probable acetyl-CoA acetyltransferase n=1 Tax=Micrococcus flavus TaxID=384602 RepID=A0A4Y8X4U0_9MICC|nr:acetyl-CoA C-acetyltransferase [Micrococcus flavus]MBB4883079.1 acetyl-CoA C-acetyltransferase [Micrococcus flavus]TFI04490.1 acetyl-CoA C-acetyltransferase [Micrococcus flavus]GGK42254.1 acetyl-CoA acetyltransferase [Micrococcus flavus]